MNEQSIDDLLMESAAVEEQGQDLKSLAEVSDMVERFQANAKQIAELENQLSVIKAKHRKLAEEELPNALDELRLTELQTADGGKLKIKTMHIGKIPEDKKLEAYTWLAEHGKADMVKTEVIAKFGMGDYDRAREVAQELEQQGLNVGAKQSVHSGTLSKFIRLSVESGETVPAELFQPSVIRRAEIK